MCYLVACLIIKQLLSLLLAESLKTAEHVTAGLQGLSIGETARLRGIKSTTIMGYLADAIFCGHAYPWPCAGVTQADIAKVMPVLEDLLKAAGALNGRLNLT